LEELLAELTDAAYRAALRQGLQGAFVDVELALWRELRLVLKKQWNEDDEGLRSASRVSWRDAAEDEALAGSC
jgi:hypothetical protein